MNGNARIKATIKGSTERSKLEQAVIDALYLGVTNPDQAEAEAAKSSDDVTFVIDILVDEKGKYSARVNRDDEFGEEKPAASPRMRRLNKSSLKSSKN